MYVVPNCKGCGGGGDAAGGCALRASRGLATPSGGVQIERPRVHMAAALQEKYPLKRHRLAVMMLCVYLLQYVDDIVLAGLAYIQRGALPEALF